jgi:hypothetical protein
MVGLGDRDLIESKDGLGIHDHRNSGDHHRKSAGPDATVGLSAHGHVHRARIFEFVNLVTVISTCRLAGQQSLMPPRNGQRDLALPAGPLFSVVRKRHSGGKLVSSHTALTHTSFYPLFVLVMFAAMC